MITDCGVRVGESIWECYLRISQAVVALYQNPKILKVDASNESGNLPIPGGIAGNLEGEAVCLEIKEDVIKLAKDKNPKLNIQAGDVRQLPFERGSFDVILDLSTIDHLHPDFLQGVLEEYYRALKTGGRLLIIPWLSDNERYKEVYGNPKAWTPSYQCRFMAGDFRAKLASLFTIEEDQRVHSYSDIYLQAFVGRK